MKSGHLKTDRPFMSMSFDMDSIWIGLDIAHTKVDPARIVPSISQKVILYIVEPFDPNTANRFGERSDWSRRSGFLFSGREVCLGPFGITSLGEDQRRR